MLEPTAQPLRLLRQYRIALAVILLLQALISLSLAWPGQLSFDSIIQLYEGRHFRFISFNPPLMSVLLGVFDRLGSGPIGFVLLSQALLSASTWMVLSQARPNRLWRWIVAGLLVLNPVILLYTGIVWKDVLLAHSIAFSYLLLDLLRRRGQRPGSIALLTLVAMLTIIVGVRQQGILFALPLAIWIAASLRLNAKWRIGMVALVLITTPLLLNKAIPRLVVQPGDEIPAGNQIGLQVLMRLDMIGILANGGQMAPGLPAGVIAELQGEQSKYSTYRVDTLDGPTQQYWQLPLSTIAPVWLQSIRQYPQAYLKHRGLSWLRLLGVGEMNQCLPLHRGVAGPVHYYGIEGDLVPALGLKSGPGAFGPQLQMSATNLANSPLFWHWCYAALLVATAIVLYCRRQWLLLTLAGCSLAFLASYGLIGIACDFRYAYTVTVVSCLLGAYTLLGSRLVDRDQHHAQ